MEILYHKGQDNVITNALSRVMNNMSFTILENSLLQEIKEAQLDDPYAQQVRSRLQFSMDTSEGSPLSTSSLSLLQVHLPNGWLKWKGKIYVPCAWEL